ncbi:MAG: response regulator [Bacilli bacterium]|nr:response regulator [Bacilli bacterium]
MINIYFQFFGLLDIVLLFIVYYTKNQYKSTENKIYGSLIVLSLVGQILHILSYVTIYNLEKIPIINLLVVKSYLIYLVLWISFLFTYIYAVTYKGRHKENYDKIIKKRIKIIILLDFVITLFVIFLPTNIYRQANIVYTYGISVNLIYVISILYITFSFLLFIKNFKSIKKYGFKKYVPLFVLILIGGIVMFIQYNNPSLLLITSTETFITLLMYFTIENPDTKMIQEMNKNRLLIEKANEDKSNFLFRMAQEVRQPIEDILKVSNIMKSTQEEETINKGIKYVEYSAKQLKSVVNNVLGVSSLDSYNIKMMSNTYNIKNLFSEIYSKYKNEIKSNIDFKMNINENIPETLYGDVVKIKQIITTLLENAIKYTKEGYIEINADAINKNDVCRLIISIEDTGCGMSIDKVNSLLSINEELNEENKLLDDINLNINVVTKIIRLLGGNILIKSEEKKGSEFIVVIEQLIKNKIDENDKLNEYTKTIFKNKRILIVDDSKEILEEITKKLNNKNLEIVTTMYGSDCVEKIKTNQKFDLILMDDDMTPDTGLATLQELQKIDKFKTPVIIMLEKNKEIIKEHYLEEGFKDYVLKFKLETEMKRIAEKYL